MQDARSSRALGRVRAWPSTRVAECARGRMRARSSARARAKVSCIPLPQKGVQQQEIFYTFKEVTHPLPIKLFDHIET